MIPRTMKIVVTGGAGFIGSHLCDELVKTSKVICIDNFVSSIEFNIDSFLANPDFKFIKHDIFEPIELEKYPEYKIFEVEFAGIAEIYNCASPTSYKDPKKLPMQTALTLGRGTKNVLDLAWSKTPQEQKNSKSFNLSKLMEELLDTVQKMGTEKRLSIIGSIDNNIIIKERVTISDALFVYRLTNYCKDEYKKITGNVCRFRNLKIIKRILLGAGVF